MASYASIITLDLVPKLFKDGGPLNYSMNNDPHQTVRSGSFVYITAILDTILEKSKTI